MKNAFLLIIFFIWLPGIVFSQTLNRKGLPDQSIQVKFNYPFSENVENLDVDQLAAFKDFEKAISLSQFKFEKRISIIWNTQYAEKADVRFDGFPRDEKINIFANKAITLAYERPLAFIESDIGSVATDAKWFEDYRLLRTCVFFASLNILNGINDIEAWRMAKRYYVSKNGQWTGLFFQIEEDLNSWESGKKAVIAIKTLDKNPNVRVVPMDPDSRIKFMAESGLVENYFLGAAYFITQQDQDGKYTAVVSGFGSKKYLLDVGEYNLACTYILGYKGSPRQNVSIKPKSITYVNIDYTKE